MANTVNDVMNVIASPDYGIKNIAGTNQEILAILSGIHNSKSNIYNLVNDVKLLLQNLVVAATTKKPVEVENKTAKINQKNIQNILLETESIRSAIENLAKAILKQSSDKASPAIAKLSNKASDKVAEAMIKSIEKQNKGGGISALVDAFSKLKDISLKDLLLGNKKVKLIMKVFKNAQKDLKIDEKELNSIIKLVNAAPEMMKALKKVGRRIDKIIKNNVIGKLSDILIGKNSLLTLSQSLLKYKKTFIDASETAKDVENLATSLNKAMKKIVFAALWSKFANGGIKSLENVLDNLTPLSQKLIDNKSDIEESAKSAKNITVLAGNLLLSSIVLTITLITAIPAILGAIALGIIIDTVIPIAKKLSKNEKNISKAIGSALLFTAFTGVMLLSSYFLTKIADNALTTLMGSFVIMGVVALNILTFKILEKASDKIIVGAISMVIMSVSLILFGIALDKISKATKDVTWKQFALIAALTGLLGGAVAILGIPEVVPFIILGSISMAIMSVSLILFGIALDKITNATKDVTWKQFALIAALTGLLGGVVAVLGIPAVAPLIIMGSITMAIMSVSLLLFSVALSNITNATKDVTWEQVGMIAALTGLLGVTVAGLALISPFILIGSAALMAMSVPLLIYSVALDKITKATKGLKPKDLDLVADSIGEFGGEIAWLALMSGPIAIGSIAVGIMGNSLNKFATALQTIKDMGGVPINEVDQVLECIEKIKDFYSDSELEIDAIIQSHMYNKLLKPFTKAVKSLNKLKKMEGIPIDLVYQTLSAMNAIGIHYTISPIKKSTIKQAKRYQKMMKPFGNTIKHLVKLKKMGNLPIKLVNQTLDAMFSIGQYYLNNPLDDDAIDEAENYEDMLEPFGDTVESLVKLKKMGNLPIKLVNQTLDAMFSIGQYYLNNPVDDDMIDEAENYEDMMEPFGNTVENFVKLKKMGNLPLKLVYQTLDGMFTIGQYYLNNPVEDDMIDEAENYIDLIEPFGEIVEMLSKLKELKSDPSESIRGVVTALSDIAWFYNTTEIGDDWDLIELKSEYTKYLANQFGKMSGDIIENFAGIQPIDSKSVLSIVIACRHIIWFYRYTWFSQKTKLKALRINSALKSFAKAAGEIKKEIGGFSESDANSAGLAVTGMTQILDFLKSTTLESEEEATARKNIGLLKDVSGIVSDLNGADTSNITSVGDSLTSALAGVNSIDISQVQAVTNMLNAFNEINKSETILNKFTESINNFTEACNNLLDAMSRNTDAINSMDSSGEESTDSVGGIESVIDDMVDSKGQQAKGIRIANIEDLAKMISENINGSLSVDMADPQIQLLINGSGGNEWTISRY